MPTERSCAPRRRWLRCAPLAIALWVGGLSLRHEPVKAVEVAKQIAAITVTTAAARAVPWVNTLSATGAIEAWQEAIIGSQSTGLRLLEVRSEVGDVVRKGDLLARFDDRMLQSEASQLRALLTQAEASALQAEANKQRALQQRESGGISEQDILAQVTLARVAAAQVDVARAQLAAKHLQLSFAEVRAPDDGIVSARKASLGAVGDGGQELFRLILRGRLEWRGQFTPAQLVQVSAGQSVQLALPNGLTIAGRVRRQAPSLDAATRLGIVYVDLPAGASARVGMYAKGSVVLRQTSALVVPAGSVVVRDGRSYVFTLADGAEPSVARMTAVSTGRRQGTDVEVLSGVAPQMQVVVQGAGFLDDGDAVRVISPGAGVSSGAAR